MERNENGQLPPLENSLILGMIFRNLEVYRQVCKQWYIISLKRWKSVSKVKISETKDKNALETYYKLINSKDQIQTEKSFATHYIIKDLKNDHSPFWTTLGSSIKTLEITKCKFPSAASFRHIIFRDCPNLEHLTLDNIRLENEDPIVEPTEWMEPQFGENFKLKSLTFSEDRLKKRCIAWMDLLSHFPAMETLTVPKIGLQTQKHIFETINMIRQHDSNKIQLKHLHNPIIVWEDDRKRPESLQVLLDASFAFESLTVLVVGFQGTESFLEVLDLRRKTLKELSLGGTVYTNQGPLVKVPVLPNRPLEKLEVFTLTTSCFHSMAFLKFTPVLRKLVLKQEGSTTSDCIASTSPDDMNGFTMPTCTELQICQHEFSTGNLEKLMDWLPNIEILKINGIDNNMFSLICKRWPGLESLDITESKVDDCGLSGFERRKDFPENSKKSKKSSSPKNPSNPNITDLKNLKYLSLDTNGTLKQLRRKPAEIVMNYRAAADAIEQLFNLKELRIENYKLTEEILWRELLAKYSS